MAVIDLLEVIDIQHHQRQRTFPALGASDLQVQAFLEVAPVVDTGQGIGDRERTQLLLHQLEPGDVGDVAMPEHGAIVPALGYRFPAQPAQALARQQHAEILAPGREQFGGAADRALHPLQVIGMDAL
ncbi:hypothetical protein D9M72_483960 [compost metagenome]